MAKKRGRIFRGEDFWRKTISEYRKSGISQTEFCKRRKLPIETFRRWFYEFNRETSAAQPAAPDEQPLTDAGGIPLFMPVKLKETPAESTYPMEIVLANGRRIRVNAEAHPDAVRGMVRMLEGA